MLLFSLFSSYKKKMSNFGNRDDDEDGGAQRFHVDEASAGNENQQPGQGDGEQVSKETRKYLKLANEVSFGKLENHLREYVRSIPFRPAPTYIPPGEKPPPPARPSKFNPDWDEVFERDETQQDILNHSASFRYCTQRLATGLHSPYELSRRFVEYKDFARVLSVPNPTNYEQLDPRVVDKPDIERNNEKSFLEMQQMQRAQANQASVAANSKFLEARIAAAQRRGVHLQMSKIDLKKELARMDAEDNMDREEDAAGLLEKRKAERDAQRELERKKREEQEAARGKPQVVNMYDLPDWRQATGRCHVTTLESWKRTKTSYF